MAVYPMTRRHKGSQAPKEGTLEILAFDACKIACRLVSLYNSLSDNEINVLRHEVIKSKGVTYLNSNQECFLLGLAAMELLEDLDESAAAVSRLGRKCSDITLSRFDLVYGDLKLGAIDLRKHEYGTRATRKAVDKMERLASATESLRAAMEAAAELEAAEKKMQRWESAAANCSVKNKIPKPNLDYLNEKMASQRKQVQHFKLVSLWNQSFDETVAIMARVVCTVYARICSVFGAYFAGSHSNNQILDDHRDTNNNVYCLIEHKELYQTNLNLSDQYEESVQKRGNKSGPLPRSAKLCDVKFYSGPIKAKSDEIIRRRNWDCGLVRRFGRVLDLAPPTTVGGAGLAVRYANVILFAERCLHAPATVGEEAREVLYEMLPERLRAMVGRKLRGRRRRGEAELARGWRDAVEELMKWLSPVANATVQWHAERNMEKKRLQVAAKSVAPSAVMLLQTLHYSDLEKAEAAIVEVLVGLSCIYWYEKR